MDQPLGHEVGNSNEVEEAIRVLKGHGAEDETEVALTIAAHMCVLGGAYGRFDEAYEALKDIIESGKAFDKLVELVEIQGGDAEVVRDTNLLPKAKRSIDVLSEESGYVIGLQAENIGVAAMLLGAGRRVKGDSIDFGAGITLKKKIGDYVEKGEVLCVLHTDHDDIEDAQQRAFDAYTIGAEKPVINPIVYETIE
jgi:pyrimidine-nucleoside phosphorylase/thymidine phosphorylase